TETRCPRYVRSSLNLRHDRAARLTMQRAITGLMRCNNKERQSTTSSARDSNDRGAVKSNSLAAFQIYRQLKLSQRSTEYLLASPREPDSQGPGPNSALYTNC